MKHLIKNTQRRTKTLEKIVLKQLKDISEITNSITIKIDLDELTKSIKEPEIRINADAYAKIMTLVHNTDKEIAWHGTVARHRNVFIIEDILVYPQEVTGATVESDDEEYPSWLFNLPDNIFDSIKMQGHSHVNMSVGASGTDVKFYADQMTQVDDYRIFMIVNKDSDFNIMLYDKENGVIFKDLDYQILADRNLNDWLEEEMKKVNKRKFKPIRRYAAYEHYKTR